MATAPYQPQERRPIATRERPISKQVAHWLAQRGISPNAISVAGMVSGLAAGLCLWLTSSQSSLARFAWIGAALFVQLRLLANMFDGMVAIEGHRASPVGELFNEVPDRISDAAILIGLGYASGGQTLLGYAAATVAVFAAYVRAMGKVAGAHQEFCGPMAKPQRMFVVTVVALYSGLTPRTWQPGWGLARAALILIICGGLWTAVRRLGRIASALNAGKGGL